MMTEPQLLLWTIDEDLGKPLLDRFAPDASYDCSNGRVSVAHHDGEGANLAETSAVAMVMKFVDAQSLTKARNAMGQLPRDRNVPIAFLLYRDPGKLDFKMSCPHCVQKLWIRDADVSKRGRCPNCKRAFDIPSQVDLLRQQLHLPKTVDVVVVSEDANLTSTIDLLLAQICEESSSAALNETTIIEIDLDGE